MTSFSPPPQPPLQARPPELDSIAASTPSFDIARSHFSSRAGSKTMSASAATLRSEEHTPALQSLMRISYADFRSTRKNQDRVPLTHRGHRKRLRLDNRQ